MLVINSRFLTQELTGVQRFAIELSLQLKQAMGDNVVFLTPHNVIHTDIAKQLSARITGTHTGHLWEQADLPRQLKKMGNPLLLCFGNTAPIFYGNKIDTLHDITFVRYPHTFSPKFLYFYRLIIPLIVRTSKHLFTVSEFSKSEIVAHYHIAPEKISVIYNAVNPIFQPVKDEKLADEKYIIAVSSMKENKNFAVAYQAYKIARRQIDGLKLYIIGDVRSGNFKGMDGFISELNADEGVRILGRISDDDLIRYYSNARAFLFPSLYEGFGIPVLEAQSCRCPVIAAASSSLPEVLGNSALLCNPNNPQEFADAICRIINDESFGKELVKAGEENLKRFSWGKSASKILHIIQTMK